MASVCAAGGMPQAVRRGTNLQPLESQGTNTTAQSGLGIVSAKVICLQSLALGEGASGSAVATVTHWEEMVSPPALSTSATSNTCLPFTTKRVGPSSPSLSETSGSTYGSVDIKRAKLSDPRVQLECQEWCEWLLNPARIMAQHTHRNVPAPWFSHPVPLEVPASSLVHEGNSLTCHNEEASTFPESLGQQQLSHDAAVSGPEQCQSCRGCVLSSAGM